MCLSFSCYAVKAGGSEGNGTALSFPERSQSQLSGFHRTLFAYRRLQREVTFQEAAGPDGRRDRCLRRAGLRGFTREGGGPPGEARGEYGTLSPKNLVCAGSGTLTLHLVQPLPHNNFINGRSQISSRAGLEPRISGPIRGLFHDFKLPNSSVCLPGAYRVFFPFSLFLFGPHPLFLKE